MTFVIISNVEWPAFPSVTKDKAHIAYVHLALGFRRQYRHSWSI